MADFIERLQQRSSEPTQQPRIMEMDDEGADEVLSALSPTTRRRLYRALFTEPQTTSELAESVDTSIQNVQYHLETLQDAGLVEPVETVYSGKGNEMTVFAPASDPLVFVGDADRLPAINESLSLSRCLNPGWCFLLAAWSWPHSSYGSVGREGDGVWVAY